MSRNHKNGLGTAIVADDALPQSGERVGDVVVVEGQHRTSVTQEDGRHCFHFVSDLSNGWKAHAVGHSLTASIETKEDHVAGKLERAAIGNSSEVLLDGATHI
ncbi:MAG: hypothetical protein LKE41_11645 [Prevotella sp.]|nr:hypothetical protein [Prevotella sp.]MCI2080566.1 hypothetical protein [Prevotella sp.]MCI2102411.1 hypothetical protein [Prevotella sp.]